MNVPPAAPGAATRPAPTALGRELNENLAALQSLLRQLAALSGQKLAAIRAGDGEALQRAAACEAELLAEVFRNERQRAAILARVAQGVPALDGKRAALSEIAGYFSEPAGSILRARHAALRQIATELQEKNNLVARVAHNLQLHLRAVFAEFARLNQESVGYGPKGQHEQRHARCWLDAVG